MTDGTSARSAAMVFLELRSLTASSAENILKALSQKTFSAPSAEDWNFPLILPWPLPAPGTRQPRSCMPTSMAGRFTCIASSLSLRKRRGRIHESPPRVIPHGFSYRFLSTGDDRDGDGSINRMKSPGLLLAGVISDANRHSGASVTPVSRLSCPAPIGLPT